MLASSVQSAIKSVVTIETRFDAAVDLLTKDIFNSCNATNIATNIQKRNNLIKVFTDLKNVTNTLTALTDILEPILTATKISITVLKASPIPNQFTTMGLVLTMADILNEASLLINQISSILSQIQTILSYLNNIINSINAKFKRLDNLLIKCASSAGITDEALSKLLSSVPQMTVVNNFSIQTYAGFNFAIKIDTNNQTPYTKHYAVAMNADGVVLLKGESSYTTDQQTLINELIYQIKIQN